MSRKIVQCYVWNDLNCVDYMLILLCLCKIVNGFVNCDVVHNLAYAKAVNTRGHRFKLFVTRCNKLVFSSFFINRVIPVWNSQHENSLLIYYFPKLSAQNPSI
jgi:hypothetical protein